VSSNPTTIGVVLTIVSVAVLVLLVAYGGLIASSQEAPIWIIIFGVVTTIYGLSSLVILFLAWRRYGKKTTKAITNLTIGYIAVFILSSLDVGMVSGLEFAGIVIVGIMLSVNWLAVSVVVKSREFDSNTMHSGHNADK